jgi:hypothetical protein
VHRHARGPQATDKTCARLTQDKDDAAQLRFARRWVNCHVDAAATIGKPVVLAEFGKKGGGPAREEFYRKVPPGSANDLGCTFVQGADCCGATAQPIGRRADLRLSRSSLHKHRADGVLYLLDCSRVLAVHTRSQLQLPLGFWVHTSARRSSAPNTSLSEHCPPRATAVPSARQHDTP